MKKQCFICHKVYDDGKPKPSTLPPDYGKDGKWSHGICKKCTPAYEAQVEKELRALAVKNAMERVEKKVDLEIAKLKKDVTRL